MGHLSTLFGTDFHGTLVDLSLQLLGVVDIFLIQKWELRYQTFRAGSSRSGWYRGGPRPSPRRVSEPIGKLDPIEANRRTRKGRVQPIVSAKYGSQ